MGGRGGFFSSLEHSKDPTSQRLFLLFHLDTPVHCLFGRIPLEGPPVSYLR